jgi:hypothetical protein
MGQMRDTCILGAGTEKISFFEGSEAVAARPAVRSHFIANLK